MKRERIDRLLVEKGLAESRTKAQALVMAGVVLVNEQRVDKPSDLFEANCTIRVKHSDDPASRYVGRGGLKLAEALSSFALDVNGAVCLDVGASTGGFTDCMLQNGAKRVIAVDVGHNQIDWRLRNDPRVEVREGINARYLVPSDFDIRFDFIVIDVSFISITKILPALVPLLVESGRVVALVKPQFEVGKGAVGRGGIVRDAKQHESVIENVNEFAFGIGLKAMGTIPSPIKGAEGNVEFLTVYELAHE